jgi:hypothetical protein
VSPIVRYKTRPYAVECDECGEQIGSEDYGGPILFDSRDEAKAQIRDWNWELKGTRVVCESCQEEELTELTE